MVVKKKRRDIGDLDLGLPEAPAFDDFASNDFEMPGMPTSPAPSAPMASPEGSLENLSSNVVSQLIHDGVPPIPTNFQLYFDRLLDEQPTEVQEEIQSLLELEGTNSNEEAMALEQKLKNAFRSIKQLLQI